MPSKFKAQTAGYVAAEPGTRLVLYRLTEEPESDKPVYRSEHRVVAWEVRSNNIDPDYRWVRPVTIEGIEELNISFCAILFSDGHIHYESDGYADFDPAEFKSVEQFGEYVAQYYKDFLASVRCLDCRVSLLGQTPSDKSPMLKHEIWQSIVPGGSGVLCRPCMERRLGRRLSRDDFLPAWAKQAYK